MGIITEETGENSLKDEDDTNNMNISKNTKLLFNRYLIIWIFKIIQKKSVNLWPSIVFLKKNRKQGFAIRTRKTGIINHFKIIYMVKTAIRDVPRNGISEDDAFGLTAYEKGLETFLRGAETPITIAIQGEQGSGKTSLMNVLHDNLCGEDDKSGEFFPIWMNTEELTLMRDPLDAIRHILIKLSKEVVSCRRSAFREIDSKILNSIMGLGAVLTKTVGNTYLNGAVDGIQEYIKNSQDNAIADLRKYIQAEMDECLQKNEGKKGFVFFIDDMDRIDPPLAVDLLVLLKNIFALKNCILVLTIDDDVVLKGLKPKYGEINDTNEYEFRSFYDKIIQVHFTMPVNQYATMDYLIEELKSMGIISSRDEHNKKFLENIVKVENLTMGSNPRSIKRYLNALSLMQCINQARETNVRNHAPTAEGKDRSLNILLHLALAGVQLAYPKVYQLLCVEPDITKWNNSIAEKLNVPLIDEDAMEGTEAFDEDWEKVLYRVCQSDKYLQKNTSKIFQLLNFLRTEILSSPTIDVEQNLRGCI